MNSKAVEHHLQERIKELTALHKTAKILLEADQDLTCVFKKIADIIPAAWQYPDHTEAQIVYENLLIQTSSGLHETPWKLSATFEKGRIDVFYTKEFPFEYEGPFLKEERHLIDSLAGMLQSFLKRHEAENHLRKHHEELEQTIQTRTYELRKVSADLVVAEEKERRKMAVELHDYLGQVTTHQG